MYDVALFRTKSGPMRHSRVLGMQPSPCCRDWRVTVREDSRSCCMPCARLALPSWQIDYSHVIGSTCKYSIKVQRLIHYLQNQDRHWVVTVRF